MREDKQPIGRLVYRGSAERRRRANELGARGELLALRYMEARGATLLARNYRCPLGEIDLVLLHEDDLVAVEVKTRTLGGLGLPEESITPWKMKRLLYALGSFVRESKQPTHGWRFDAIVIDVDNEYRVHRIEHYKSIYEDE